MSITAHITLRRAGGSLIATIPKDVVEAKGLHAGEKVAITITRRVEAFDALRETLRGVDSWDRSWTRGRDRY